MNGLDIYSYNLKSGDTLRLTETPDNWDEFPYSFPAANKLIWMSGINLGGSNNQLLQTDYWMMDYDGSNKVQLTFYNDKDAVLWNRFFGVSCARMSWSPDGQRFAAHTIPNGVAVSTAGTVTLINVEPAAPTLSAASFYRPPLSSNSIVTTFYPNLASQTKSATSTDLPTTLDGTTITVTDSLGMLRTAPLYFVSQNQVNWQIPDGAADGPATIQFANGQGATVRDTVDIETVGPGLFAINGTGSGPAAGYLLVYPTGSTSPSSSQFLFDCSSGTCKTQGVNLGFATDAAYLILFGTGLRHANGTVTATVVSTTSTMGGEPLPVSFSGAQGVSPGLDQINIPVPISFAGGGAVNVSLTVDGVATNTVQANFQ